MAVMKCCLCLTSLLIIDIDVLDKAHLKDPQQWLSFNFNVPAL